VWLKPFALRLVFIAILASSVIFGWAGGSFTNVGDVWLFAHTGSTLLSGNWSHTFHFSTVQAGPLELILTAVAKSIGGGPTGFAIVLDLVCMAAVAGVAVALLGRRPRDLAVFGIGACLLSLPEQGYRGHPAELLIAVLWLLAAREARRGRTALAGGLVGLSACFELWGILGVTVLALAPSLRRCGPGAGIAIAVPVACLLPFVVGGDFHAFQFHWTVTEGPARLLVGYGHPFTWWLRVAEGATVVIVSGLIARAVRGLPESIWMIPAITQIVRIELDPMTYGYYWDTALIALLIGATQILLHRQDLADRLAAHFPTLRRQHFTLTR
jgi:hypothetical protein